MFATLRPHEVFDIYLTAFYPERTAGGFLSLVRREKTAKGTVKVSADIKDCRERLFWMVALLLLVMFCTL